MSVITRSGAGSVCGQRDSSRKCHDKRNNPDQERNNLHAISTFLSSGDLLRVGLTPLLAKAKNRVDDRRPYRLRKSEAKTTLGNNPQIVDAPRRRRVRIQSI